MTPEQASKLRKGDRILVEMVVTSSGLYMEGCVLARCESNWEHQAKALPTSAIREALPRPLEAGDRVVAVDDPVSGEIIAICGDEGWVRWPAGDTSVEPLSDLRRVEDQ